MGYRSDHMFKPAVNIFTLVNVFFTVNEKWRDKKLIFRQTKYTFFKKTTLNILTICLNYDKKRKKLIQIPSRL